MRALPIFLLAFAACGRGGGSEGGAPSGGKGGPGGRGPLMFPVEVQPIESRSVEYRIAAVGSVEAFEEIQVTARVPGVIEKISFTEGDEVKEGAKLVEIEPRRYQIAVDAARAAFQRAEAQRAEAEAALARREEANKKSPGLVKQEEIDAARTKLQAARAAQAEAKSALNLAELNLHDAFVRAPIAGMIESRLAKTGQYVQPGAAIASLVRRDPLLLRFKVPEADARSLGVGQQAKLKVRGTEGEHSAEITHVAQAADEKTRMVTITAKISDPEKQLKPGAFAEVTVPIGGAADAPVIPETAVRPSEHGFLAFVIEGDVARQRIVTLGLRTGDGKVEVRSGVSPGEQLVVRGAEALREGAKVRVVEGGQKTPAPSAEAGGARP